MKYRTLGTTEEKLSAIGLGCVGMSFAYGPADESERIATLHKALDFGINFWDTADCRSGFASFKGGGRLGIGIHKTL